MPPRSMRTVRQLQRRLPLPLVRLRKEYDAAVGLASQTMEGPQLTSGSSPERTLLDALRLACSHQYFVCWRGKADEADVEVREACRKCIVCGQREIADSEGRYQTIVPRAYSLVIVPEKTWELALCVRTAKVGTLSDILSLLVCTRPAVGVGTFAPERVDTRSHRTYVVRTPEYYAANPRERRIRGI
jgi:hypothetical protein